MFFIFPENQLKIGHSNQPVRLVWIETETFHFSLSKQVLINQMVNEINVAKITQLALLTITINIIHLQYNQKKKKKNFDLFLLSFSKLIFYNMFMTSIKIAFELNSV